MIIDSTWDLWKRYSTKKSNLKANKINQYYEKKEKEIFLQMSHIFTVSKIVKDNLIGHYRIPEHSITNIGTGTNFSCSIHKDKNYDKKQILFVAKCRFKDKGRDLLLDAFDIVIKRIPDVKLFIVGHEIKNLRHKNVISFGFLSNKELQKIYNQSTLFVMPAYNEPWGIVYLEALQCKIPIIGSNRYAFPEICQNDKFGYISELNHLKLAETIIHAFSNPDELKRKAEQGYLYATENYSWENSVNKIINKIDEY